MGATAAKKGLKLLRGEPLDEPHSIVEPRLVLRGTDARLEPDRPLER